jgi:hypothetical protein
MVVGPPSGARFRGLQDEDLEEYLADLKREIERVQGRLGRTRGAAQ